jgi:N-acetylmuramic acid 6-phosphate etherase
MVRLGKTYGNLMVDLKAWNDKLADRSERIVMETTGRDRGAARAALAAAEGGVKTAIVMVKLGVGRGEAERLIEAHLGRLRELLGDPPDVVIE